MNVGFFLNFMMVIRSSFVTNTAVNILTKIPIPSVIANPLMDPVPKPNNTVAAMSVVAFESKIVLNDSENPI